ncbi:hypothetical protein L1887_15282 [Cichorium endivia]|nr:hypothetical protein L1887_15282 [Cichorium endivia]
MVMSERKFVTTFIFLLKRLKSHYTIKPIVFFHFQISCFLHSPSSRTLSAGNTGMRVTLNLSWNLQICLNSRHRSNEYNAV